MVSIKQSILSNVSQKVGLPVYGDYLLYIADHAAVGYALNVTPTWFSVLRCLIPLYDAVPYLHLSFSANLGESQDITQLQGKAKTKVDFLSKIVVDAIQDHPLGNLGQTLEGIRDVVDSVRYLSPYYRKTAAFTDLYLGSSLSSLDDLHEVATIFTENPGQTALRGADEILKIAKESPDLARATLKDWETERRLGLEAGKF